jgi:hypothetical protein
MIDAELLQELDELEADLRMQAEAAKRTADGMREAAKEHDGRAIGLLQAAEALRNIERPQ